MIDTIRIKTDLLSYVWNAIELKKKAAITSRDVMKLVGIFEVPPYNAVAKVETRDYKSAFIEVSLPKVAYGHNVALVYPQQIPSLLQRIEMAFVEEFGDITSYKKWQIQRLDTCYAWKFPDNDTALQIIKFLRTLEYPAKKLHVYKDETVTFGGRSFSITYYRKEQEFVRFGYKKLLRDGHTRIADEAKLLSKGVLRYEIRLFRQKLSLLLNKRFITYEDIMNIDFYYNVLNACLTKTLKNANRTPISDVEAISKLRILYKSEVAMRLFYFWKVYYSEEMHMKDLIKHNTNATTIAKNLQKLSVAGVGIPLTDTALPFDLSIPNENVVTPAPPVAQATERKDKPKGVQLMFDLLFEK